MQHQVHRGFKNGHIHLGGGSRKAHLRLAYPDKGQERVVDQKTQVRHGFLPQFTLILVFVASFLSVGIHTGFRPPELPHFSSSACRGTILVPGCCAPSVCAPRYQWVDLILRSLAPSHRGSLCISGMQQPLLEWLPQPTPQTACFLPFLSRKKRRQRFYNKTTFLQ